jgi:CheY-like chemotaxis protein
MKQQKATVLVIDDDEAMREYVCFVLEKAGYKVLSAKDGSEGIATATASAPDLIITDLVMPDMEGIETIRKLKSLNPSCGIVAMSGAANSDTYLAMAQCLGAHTVLQKPFARSQVEEAVRTTLEKSSALSA